jgi:Domain of unknown function (DUF4189)
MNLRSGWVVLAAMSVIEPVSSRAVRADAAIAIADWGIAGAASGPSRRHAAELAVEECRRNGGRNCRPVASVEQGCIAIAVSSVRAYLPHASLATSWSQDEAQREARRKCSQEDGGYRCRIDASACDQHLADARPAACDRENHGLSCPRSDGVRADPPAKEATEPHVPETHVPETHGPETHGPETHVTDSRTRAALNECQQKAVPRQAGEYACGDEAARNLFIAMSYEKIEPTITTTTEGTLLKRALPSGIVTCWFAIEQYTAKEHLPLDQYECRIKRKLSEW